jgi:uncharacterized lipoprotein YddW (UPF0748 family)
MLQKKIKNNFLELINRIIFILFLFFLSSTHLSASSLFPQVKSNALWIKSNSILDTTSIDSLVNFSVENKINKLFVQIRSRGDALYNSKLVPKHERLDSLFDPLNYIIFKTDTLDLEIHAWFNTYLLWSSSIPPESDKHLYYNCEGCFEVDLNGKSDKSIKLNQFHSSDWEGIFLSPMNPDVNNHLLDVILEVVNDYNIDGVHLDYLRYQDNFYGYNKYGLLEFEDKFSINPVDLKRGLISKRFGYEQTYVDSIKDEWNNFKINKITQFLRSVKYSLLEEHPNVMLSTAVKPDILEAKYRWYQDWVLWVEEDIVDFCVIMNYYTNLNKFISINNIIDSRLIDKSKINIGISAFNQSQKYISNKIFYSRLSGFSHFTLFPYEIEKDTTDWYDSIYNTLNFYIE